MLQRTENIGFKEVGSWFGDVAQCSQGNQRVEMENGPSREDGGTFLAELLQHPTGTERNRVF